MTTKLLLMVKEVISVTLDKELIKRLNSYCHENFINRSKLVEGLLKKYLEDKDK